MRKLQALFFVGFTAITVTSCSIEGVKGEEKQTTKGKTEDTTEKTADVKPLDSLEVNFDSVFAFAEKKPNDSLVLPSGVKLAYIVHGNGAEVKKYDVVALNYRGGLMNGKIIESNEMFKQPVPFVVGLGMTFKAFDEVLQKCRYGDKIRFVIPAAQAYGKKGRGDVVPPNSNLVYEMEVASHVEGTKTKSGVEIFLLYSKQGGAQPIEGDKIELGYMGWVKKTGELFDASAASGKPGEFVLGKPGAITAWQEAVAQMHEGDKVLAIAPAAACYGSAGVPELVPPNSDLVYILELRSVEKGK